MHKQGRGRKRGRKRIPSRLHTVSTEPDMGLKLTNCEIMTWAEIKSRTLNWLSYPGGPIFKSIFLSLFIYLFWERQHGQRGRERGNDVYFLKHPETSPWHLLSSRPYFVMALGQGFHQSQLEGWGFCFLRIRMPLRSQYIFLSLFIYFERERSHAGRAEREGERERERERERENPKQAPQCQHRAWHGAQTHKWWDHDLSQNQELDA